MKPKLIELASTAPLIPIEQCRSHLEQQSYGDTDIDPFDDAMIEGRLAAAQQHCEEFLGLFLTQRVVEIALDSFPTTTDGVAIDLPWGPVQSIVSISWPGESDDGMAPEEYVFDNHSTPARVLPVAGAWPSVTKATNTIKVRYLTGYGTDTEGGEELPASIRAAVLLTLGDLHRDRENSADGAMAEVPTSAQALLRPLRVRLGMA